MIRLVPPIEALSGRHLYGLLALLDASRVLRVVDESAAVTELHLVEGPPVPLEVVANPAKRVFEVSDGRLTLPEGLLDTVANLAGAVDEQASTQTDRHGRVPSSGNPLVASGLERQAVVNRLGRRFRDALVFAAGSRPLLFMAPWPEGHRWAAAITHDLDVVAGWPLFLALRAAELTRKGAVRLAAAAVVAGVRQIGRDPVRAALEQILDVERDLSVPATWFVLAGRPSLTTWLQGDVTYDVGGRRARALVGRIAGEAHELGLHGSFQTGREGSGFAGERRRLGEVSATSIEGVRQHFLKIRPGPTQRAMEGAGFTYDASLGFPDRSGFRLGVADVVPSWDAAAGRVGKLDEVPLIWMDRAASKYAGVEDPARWVDEALASAEECRSVEGLWTGLWHPNLTTALGFPAAEREFRRLVEGLKERQPWMAPLREVVRWCRIRRGLVARVVDASGQPAVQGESFGGRGVVLEDFRGSARFGLPV